ncbi:MAG: hypothetical protein NTX48_11925 [Planctomycetales bacterium]|nr:hypothetical protein [Planctomycetales bacterium]
MVPNLFERRIAATMAAFLLWNVAETALSQQISAPLDSGFARTSSIAMSVDEMLGSRKTRALTEPILGPGYPAVWIAEVQYKPVRLRRLEVLDPKTGIAQKELVRYMVYRMILRDPTELAGAETAELRRKLTDPNVDPENTLDPNVTLPLQLPRFILKTEDQNHDLEKIYVDEINLNIQKAVFEREFGRRGLTMKMLNSVEAIAEVGKPVPGDDKDALSKAVYGVAVWRNVDPKADFFSVIMSGFSNAYRISTDEKGNRIIEEKVIVQRFRRPGDEFDQDEQEFRFKDDSDTDGDGKIDVRYPDWQWRVRDAKLNIDHMDTILRNAKVSFGDAQNTAPDAGNAPVPAPAVQAPQAEAP